MAMSLGNVFAQGVLGSVMGGAQAAGRSAEEEQRAKVLKDLETFKSELATGQYRARQAIDIENIPKKTAAETDAKVAAEEKLRPGIIETRRQTTAVDNEGAEERERTKRNIGIEYAPDEAAAKAEETRLVESAKLPFRLAEIKAQGDNSIRVAEVQNDEAAKRDWTAGADGKYYDAKGRAITTRVKIEGRGFEEVPVMVPAAKMNPAGSQWKEKEELDSINRQIEQAQKDMNDPMKRKAAKENLPRLLARKKELNGDKGGSAGQFKSASEWMNSVIGAP